MSAFSGAGPLLKSSHAVSTRAASRFSSAFMYEKQDVEQRVAELRASWQKTCAKEAAEQNKPEPSQEQFEGWAEEALAEEARREEVLKSLEAEIAASDAEAAARWNSPEMVAARAAKAAERAAAKDSE